MFQVHNLRVFFLTRHLSLIDACRAVKKERVLDYISRCTSALKLLGLKNPSMPAAAEPRKRPTHTYAFLARRPAKARITPRAMPSAAANST